MRILYQITTKEMAVALETAAASRRAGHDVALFLATDAVMAADPEKYLTKGSYLGMQAPKPNARWLLDNGVPFYVHREYAEKIGIRQSPQVVFATFDQLAAELANFDRVLVY